MREWITEGGGEGAKALRSFRRGPSRYRGRASECACKEAASAAKSGGNTENIRPERMVSVFFVTIFIQEEKTMNTNIPYKIYLSEDEISLGRRDAPYLV